MKRYFIVPCMAVFFLSGQGCSERKQPLGDSVPVINCNTGAGHPEIGSVEVIPLETTDNSLLANIQNIAWFDGRFIIQSNDRLFLFDGNGKFIRNIGTIGRGNGEYFRLNAFYVCDEGISIVDEVLRGVLTYSFDGVFLGMKELPENSLRWSYRASALGCNEFLLAYMNNFENDAALAVIDLDDPTGPTSTTLAKHVISTSNYGYAASYFPMTRYEEHVSFVLPLDDTIFEYAKGIAAPKYVMNTSLEKATREEIAKIENFNSSSLTELGSKNRFTAFRGIFETGKHFILNYYDKGTSSGYYLVDKSKLAGEYRLYEFDPAEPQFPFMPVIGVAGEMFIGECNASLLKKLLTEHEYGNVKFDKTATDYLDANSNPCLILYGMK